jgi:hypothetical protein|tara:strand:- start:206 stop:442 length:237 start_codon:yes stop_codon:yes gene_type:complete
MSENNLEDLPKGLKKDTTTYPLGQDPQFKALRDKSEDDSNSYSKINKKIISELKSKTKDGPLGPDPYYEKKKKTKGDK